MWIGSEQNLLCASANEESGPLANNAPLTYSDEPGTMLAWADVDWSGDAMTCKSTSAGAVQLENHGVEAWSVLQQVVSFNSDESESYAIEAPNVNRWIIAESKITGLARTPRLVPKTWLSERSELLKRRQTRLTASTKRLSVREGPRRNSLELAERSDRRRRKPQSLTKGGDLRKWRLR